ncbi:hypothetical protein HK405_010668, partial [Cladochytrium tenue]
PFRNGQSFSEGLTTLNDVIFRDAAKKGVGAKYLALFPGLGFAAGYKILQRIYKFGGQPFVNDFLNSNYRPNFVSAFGEKNAKTMMHATAGSLIGIGEIVLLPMDVLKIKMQTNPQSIQGKSLSQILYQEGWGLYRGATWTAARNAPGSFALFGGSAVVKEHVFGLTDYSKATFFQNFCASIGGAIASITVSAPLDVVKTRIQAKSSDMAEGGWSIVSRMAREEGFGSFFKSSNSPAPPGVSAMDAAAQPRDNDTEAAAAAAVESTADTLLAVVKSISESVGVEAHVAPHAEAVLTSGAPSSVDAVSAFVADSAIKVAAATSASLPDIADLPSGVCHGPAAGISAHVSFDSNLVPPPRRTRPHHRYDTVASVAPPVANSYPSDTTSTETGDISDKTEPVDIAVAATVPVLTVAGESAVIVETVATIEPTAMGEVEGVAMVDTAVVVIEDTGTVATVNDTLAPVVSEADAPPSDESSAAVVVEQLTLSLNSIAFSEVEEQEKTVNAGELPLVVPVAVEEESVLALAVENDVAVAVVQEAVKSALISAPTVPKTVPIKRTSVVAAVDSQTGLGFPQYLVEKALSIEEFERRKEELRIQREKEETKRRKAEERIAFEKAETLTQKLAVEETARIQALEKARRQEEKAREQLILEQAAKLAEVDAKKLEMLERRKREEELERRHQEKEAFAKALALKSKLEAEEVQRRKAEQAAKKQKEFELDRKLMEKNDKLEELEKKKREALEEEERLRLLEIKRKEEETFAKLEEIRVKKEAEEKERRETELKKKKEEEVQQLAKLEKQKAAMQKFEEQKKLKLLPPEKRFEYWVTTYGTEEAERLKAVEEAQRFTAEKRAAEAAVKLAKKQEERRQREAEEARLKKEQLEKQRKEVMGRIARQKEEEAWLAHLKEEERLVKLREEQESTSRKREEELAAIKSQNEEAQRRVAETREAEEEHAPRASAAQEVLVAGEISVETISSSKAVELCDNIGQAPPAGVPKTASVAGGDKVPALELSPTVVFVAAAAAFAVIGAAGWLLGRQHSRLA